MSRGPLTPSSLNGNGYTQEQRLSPRAPPTPSSMHSNGRSASPATVASGRKSPYRMPPRSATAPSFPRSSSPDIPLPQECAFPVFPTPPSRSTTPTTLKKAPLERAKTEPPQPQMQSHVGRVESGNELSDSTTNTAVGTRNDVGNSGYTFVGASGPLSRPASPAALYRGVQRPASPAPSYRGVQRPSAPGAHARRKYSFSNAMPAPESLVPSEYVTTLPRPQQDEVQNERPQLPSSLMVGAPSKSPVQQHTTYNDTPAPSGPLPKRPTESHVRKQSVSAAHRPLDEIGSMKTHRHTPSRGRSPTKLDSSVNGAPRSASATGHWTNTILDDAPPLPVPTEPMREALYGLRSASVTGVREGRLFDTPPLPQQAQFFQTEPSAVTNHTPSESTSSNGSNETSSETASSRSSPPASTTSSSPGREFASLEKVLSSIPPTPAEQPPAPSYAAVEVRRRGPAKSFSRPSYAVSGPAPLSAIPPPPVSIPTESKSPSQPESPMDPALKGGRLPPLVTDDKHFPPASSRQPEYPQSAVTPYYRGPSNFPDLAPPPLSFQKTPARRATLSHKGKCRGCSEVITGKSVSSADGRLTGRWHKRCFVCKTCKEPFPTMDFYVLGNDPYCSRHYHQLNKSLCSNCDRGIEGQYVETEQQKFHPHCFNCRVSFA